MMDLDSDHARAFSRSLHSLAATPTPARAHKRQRSRSTEATFVSTAIIPAPSSTEILSSLINSLTLLSDSAREQAKRTQKIAGAIPRPSTSISQSVDNFVPALEFQDNNPEEQRLGFVRRMTDANEGDIAEPPVVGYTRGRSKSTKMSVKERWATHRTGKSTQLSLERAKSSQMLRSSGHSSKGSIQSGSKQSRNPSAVTLPLPARSRDVHTPPRMLTSSRSDHGSMYTRTSPVKDFDVRSQETTLSKDSARQQRENDRGNRAPDSAPLFDEPPPVPALPVGTPESRIRTPLSPLSPLQRDDLGDHLIPSRRSSLRHISSSPRNKSDRRSLSRSGASAQSTKSPSTDAVDLKEPNVDQDLATEEDATVRRIRELQQAKERRRTEWLKEAGREKSARRARKLSHRSSPGGNSSKHSHSTTTAESPSSEELPQSTTIVQETELVSMVSPTKDDPNESEEITATVISQPSTTLSRNSSIAFRSPLSSPMKHKRAFSGNHGRSSSFKNMPVEDVQSVFDQIDAFLAAPRLTQRIRHPRTGRTIAFSEVGDPNGSVVIVCVGMGLTRYVTSFYDDIAKAQKLRLITLDRPGVGETSPFSDGVNAPLTWVDDVAVLCSALNIERFSLLAHSAGCMYALATALKMPHYVRGRIHLLAPWIPASQFGNNGVSEMKSANLPISHKILSVLPSTFLKAANSRFLSATNASIDPRLGKSKKDRSPSVASFMLNDLSEDSISSGLPSPANTPVQRLGTSPSSYNSPIPFNRSISSPPLTPSPTPFSRPSTTLTRSLTPQARQHLYNNELTHRTWHLSTYNAQPANDLLICLERRRTVGFQYADVTRAVVIHHGRNDARVPLANAKWLSESMKRCELRVIEDEGHSLLASATVMSSVLGEIGKEWEQWSVVAKDKEKKMKIREEEKHKEEKEKRDTWIKRGHY